MLIENALARPFSKWNIELGEGEPAYGYFARLVANEDHTSARVYANEVGLKGRNLVPEELLSAINCLPLSQEQVAKLEQWTPIREGNFYRFGSETARLKHVSFTTRRWCRSCLAEAAHHRVWWDFTCYEGCPKHHEKLVSQTDLGEVIRWYWPFFDLGPKGDSLVAGDRQEVDIEPRLEKFIEDRLLGRQQAVLEGVSLYHVIDASEFLGRFLTSGEGFYQIGFDALTMPEGDLRELLRLRILEVIPAELRKKGVFAALGHLAYDRSANEEGSLRPWIEQLLLQAFAQVGRIGRKLERGIEIERREFTLIEAAGKLDVTPRALSRFAKHFGIGYTPRKAAHSFSKEDVEVLQAKINELISLPETVALTGVPAHEFRFLERAGLIKGHTGMVRGAKGTRYLKSDVEKMVAKALANVWDEAGEMVTLWTYARQRQLPQGEVITKVVKGELVPRGMDGQATGFRRMMFGVDNSKREWVPAAFCANGFEKTSICKNHG
jgi:hypothetical protein